MSKSKVVLSQASSKMIHVDRLEQLFSYKNLIHAISGATGSVIAMAVFYPLDTARTRLQVDDKRQAKSTHFVIAELIKDEGVTSLYRGLFPVLVTLCCSNFVYFYTYNGMKTTLLGPTSKPSPAKDMLFAFVAGCVNVILTTPLWVVNTRLKLQGAKFYTSKHNDAKLPKYKGILDALLKIQRHEGICSLWNGTFPSLILTANPSIQFMVYETVKRYFQQLLKTKELSGFLYFIIGAIAKTVSTIVTYPLQIVQSRLRTGLHKHTESKNLIQSLRDLIRADGFKGLYKGMEAKLLQTVLMSAFMFLTYEKIAAFIFHMFGISKE
ncbi:hypothetical protein FSP39_003920 [Pinctada imbricata]|uniref:Solute carrier family 25 member 17 n=1 Tax=Pinctada imbricata TaxID=66713 RepID=A0AA88XNW3_PINIB|nr:hypothetical protein FSP39_003920 [Pinctada imbricata]